jgi:O-antigen/teichoic acid export membrane protein
MGDDLKKKMVGALTWSTIDRFGQQAVQFVIGIILARLISIADFGLIGMVMVFSALSFVLVESGFGLALVRKQDATETDFNTIFYFNIFTSVLLYCILFFSIPAISVFFKQPQLILIGRVIFLAILFNALYLVPFVKLGKAMDYKTIAKVNLISTALSGICGVVLAVMHFGVWALVAQQVLYHFFRMITFYSFVKWKPKLLFSFEVIRNFWSFSIHLLGTSILNVLFNNLYVLIIGKYYQKNEVGLYTQANKLSETFNFSFQAILLGSTYSLFSQIQNDEERFRRVFRELAQKTSIITFPIMLVLIAVAYPFIFVLLSEKWIPAVPYFQFLCLASLFGPLYTLNISALNSRGQSKITFRIEIIKKCLILLSVVICFNFGIFPMLWGYALATFIAYLISILYLKSNLTHYIKHQISDFSTSISVGVFIAICDYGLSYLIQNNHILLGAQVLLSAVLYFFCIKLFYNELYIKTVQFIKEKVPFIKKQTQVN